jgi:hypothetical protein
MSLAVLMYRNSRSCLAVFKNDDIVCQSILSISLLRSQASAVDFLSSNSEAICGKVQSLNSLGCVDLGISARAWIGSDGDVHGDPFLAGSSGIQL